LATPALAGPNCTCRANGTTFEIGQIACITLPSGQRLAQCGMVLNNTSWKILSGSCPTSFLENQDFGAPVSAPADNAGKSNSDLHSTQFRFEISG
jgi:hypothetical protein